MRRMIAIMMMLGTAGPVLVAQSPYAPGAGAGGRGNGDTPRPTPIVEPLPTPEDLAGPAVPDFMVDRFELDSAEARTYRVVYDSFMTATRTLRDSALASRRRIDLLWQSGDREGAQSQFPRLRRLGEALEKEDGHFDDRMKRVFSKPHYKDYRDWRDDQRKQAEADRKERMRGMAPSNPDR